MPNSDVVHLPPGNWSDIYGRCNLELIEVSSGEEKEAAKKMSFSYFNRLRVESFPKCKGPTNPEINQV